MSKLQEDKLAPIVINLGVAKDQINESWLTQFGTAIELLLKRMFRLNNLDFALRGPKNSVDQFVRTIKKEREYASALKAAGLTSSHALSNKSNLEQAVKKFEKMTGIKWPLK
jgi:hypothetical protein